MVNTTCIIPQIHQDDIGVKLQLELKDQDNVVIDISGATTKEITVQKPDGNNVGPTAATFVTNGTDGKMQILSVSGMFNLIGPGYKYQGHIVLPGGEDLHTEIFPFEVHKNL